MRASSAGHGSDEQPITLATRCACDLPARIWRAAARISAWAAVVMLGLHRNAGFVAAGLLAAGAAVAAQAEAHFRARRGRASDLGGVIAAAMALAAILVCLLGLAAGHQLR